MKKFLTLFFMLTLLFTAFSQQSNCPPTVTHLGVTYNTVWVGGNCWMRENLRSAQYGTQSNIDLVYPGLQPTYVTYPGAPISMGYLYTWYSAVGLPEGSTANPPTAISERVQGICPNEWAIPSAAQLEALLASGETRTETQSYWAFNTGTIPSGSNGFLMVPSGYYNTQFNQFAEYNHVGYLWTLNYNGTTSTCGIFPFDCRSTASMSLNKTSLLSVRCVKAPPYGVEEITACDSITWNGVTRYTTGRYVANLPNDSVSTLLLTVNYTTYETVKLVACDSYYWNLTDDTYTTSGVHQATIQNYLNCDSVVTLDLEVRYSNTGIDVQNHCDSYTWIDGITYTESTNTPTFVVTNAAGCDSTVTLNLTIRKMTTGIDVQDHCDTYTWIDGITYTESTNTPTYTLTNAVGCDSVVTLNLTIRNKTYGIDVQDHCDSYTWINGITYTQSTNEPVYTITNVAGCDSIVTLNLTIRNSTSSPSQSVEAINTYSWNDMTYTTSGVYTATLTNAVGCDSTATLDLTVFYQFPITYNVNGGVMPVEYPINYIQGVGATLPIPTKPNNRFDGWFDNATFTGSPITAISNSESGDKQYYALWTVLQTGLNSYLSFSGSSTAYAQIPDAPELNPTTAVTLEAWIYPTAWRTNRYEGTIVGKEKDNNTGYQLRCGASGTLSFAIGNGTSFPEVYSTSGALTLNQWQHVAGVYDGTTLKIYKNGVLLTSYASTGTIGVNTNPLEIGRLFQYNSRYFTGRIDEVRVYNTAINDATLLEWYNKSVNNTHSNFANLVGYYDCETNSNPSVLVGTVGPNGTIANATYNNLCTTSPFNNSNISAPSSISTVHPLPQYNTIMYPVVPGDTLAQILRVDVKAALGGNVTQIVLSTNGSTNPADITRARLWYTGTSTTFSTATPFGTPVMNPNGTMTFTGNQALSCGSTYYFFLTYDINPTATIGNVVDAELVNAIVERLTVTPTVGAPTGNRPVVDPCNYHILQIRDSYGDTWQGNIIAVLKNADTLFSNLTILEGPGLDRYLYQRWYDFPFTAISGDTIRVIKTTAGLGTSECKFKIVRGNTEIVSETTVSTPPAIYTGVAGCYNVITASSNSNGTIAPSGSVRVYINNPNQTFNITPNSGYYIDSVLVNGVNNTDAITSGTYTFTNITSAHTIRVVFKTNLIAASSGSNGTITPSGSVPVALNANQLFTFTPNAGYFVDSLIVDGIKITSAPNYTFTGVNAPHTIRVTYATNAVTPTLITPPTTSIAYEGYPLSTVTLSGGTVEYNGTPVAGTFSWVNPTSLIPVTATFTQSVIFTPTLNMDYFPITFNVTGNITAHSVLVANGTTTNSTLPIYGYNMDNPQNSFVLYPDTMLTSLVGKTITHLVFYYNNTTNFNFTSTSTINLGPTTLTELPSTGDPAFTPTTVFTGTVSKINGYVIITLTTPYLYTGGNLMYNFVNPDGGNYQTTTFYGVNRTNCGRYTYNTTTTRGNFVPKVKFLYQL